MDNFLPLKRTTPTATQNAIQNISPYTIHTPLIPLNNFVRADLPNLKIYLKLENLQPGVGSFKIRGAANAILTRLHEQEQQKKEKKGGNDDDDGGGGEDEKEELVVVTASAGNMGQGVAHICQDLPYKTKRKCRCVVIVPENAPLAKTNIIQHKYKARVIRVPYDTWWNVIETSDCSFLGKEIVSENYIFIHPVCDAHVVAGNSTVGLEILEGEECGDDDDVDVDAIFVPYGGGGLSCGIGSAVQNYYQENNKQDIGEKKKKEKKKCKVISCEPETAAPMALSKHNQKMTSFSDHYQSSFVDGCGGKAVLSPMWDLAQEVVDESLAVPLDVVEGGVWALHECNGIVAEGAGGVSVGAAMFAPIEKLSRGIDGDDDDVKKWKKVVCVISGRGINGDTLRHILEKYTSIENVVQQCQFSNWEVRGTDAYEEYIKKKESILDTAAMNQSLTNKICSVGVNNNSKSPDEKITVLSAKEVSKLLPMNKCIQSTKKALIALSTQTGKMPIRQVSQLPFDEIEHQPGYLVSMPSYSDGYAACKLITVYPQNSKVGKSSHQGLVALFDAKQHGDLICLADAHEITSIRTAAASAVATMALARTTKDDDDDDAKVLALLGTGEQSRSHFISMMETGLPFEQVYLWGRNTEKTRTLEKDLNAILDTYKWQAKTSSSITIQVFDTVKECVKDADVICTLVPSTTPVLHGEWIKPGCHINAVGACLPSQREMDGNCLAKCKVYCDSMDACFVEAGDVVMAIEEGSVERDHVVGEIGSVLCGELEGRKDDAEITLFKSLGIALEDLEAIRAIHEELLSS